MKYIIIIISLIIVGLLYFSRNIDVAVGDSVTPVEGQVTTVNTDENGCTMYHETNSVGKSFQPIAKVICKNVKDKK